MKRLICLCLVLLPILAGCGFSPSPREQAEATQIVAVVQITQTAAVQQLTIKSTAAAVEVVATQDSNKVQATGTYAISQMIISGTQSVLSAQLTQIPAVVQNQTTTSNTNRTTGMVALILGLVIAVGLGYYLIQLTRTKSMVAANGLMVRGNTFVPIRRLLAPTTVTPPGPLQIAQRAVLQLTGKNPAPLHDQVTTDDKGATARDLLMMAAADLYALAQEGAAQASKIVVEKGAVGTGGHLTIHQAPQLPQPAPQSAQLPMDVTVNRLDIGGPASDQVQSVLAQLGYKMPPLLAGRPDGQQIVDVPGNE